jgi:hypothetical protein
MKSQLMFQDPTLEGTFRNKLNAYFLSKGFYDYRRGWLKGECPDCGREDKYGIHLGDARTNCFVCGYNEPPLFVVKRMERFKTLQETKDFIKTLKEVRVKFIAPKDKVESKLILPQGFRLLSVSEASIAKKIKTYLNVERRIELYLIKSQKIGFVSEVGLEYDGYIIFPFYDKDKLVYFQGRALSKHKFPKFKNPDEEVTGVGKGNVIYNIDALWKYKEVNCVESILNCLTLFPNTISLEGKEISPWQLNQIRTSPVEIVNILLDPDAWEQAIALAEKLVPLKSVRIIKLPDNEDVNSLGKSHTLDILKYQDTIYNNIAMINKLKYGTDYNTF